MRNQPIDSKATSSGSKKSIAVYVKWLLGILFAGVCVFLVINKTSNGKKFNEVKIEIEPLPNKINFLDEKDIHQIIDSLTDQPDFKKANCEAVLEQNPYIKNAEVFVDLKQNLFCKITQRQPIVRVINSAQQQYYIDKEGTKFNVITGTSARVLVANGYIKEKRSPQDSLYSKTLKEVFKVASYVESELFWKQFTEQLYVDKYNDLILIPKVGSFTIVLGNSERLEEKFSDLKVFITTALPKVGYEKYKTLSVKYKGQIVTKKK